MTKSSAPQKTQRITASDITVAIRESLQRQQGNGLSAKWAVFEELRFGTGFRAVPNSREEFSDTLRVESRIDVFALCTWPSSQYLRRAYEIKVDRGDLKNELARPEKRAPWLEVVNEFYFVTPPGLTSPAEIEKHAPECGLMVFDPIKVVKPALGDWRTRPNFGLRTLRRGMSLEGCEPSWRLVASILRSCA